MKDERLESLSDEIRKGNPIGLKEAIEVVEYQEGLRKARQEVNQRNFAVVKGIAAIVCTIVGTLCVIFGEMDDSPGLGGIGLIIILSSAYLNSKLLYEKKYHKD